MRIFGILFSCVCLQLVSGPATAAICPDGLAVQGDPEQAKEAFSPESPEVAELTLSLAGPFALLATGPAYFFEKSFSLGPKEFLIRSGLSPPSIFGRT
jgi:hypothetical protein